MGYTHYWTQTRDFTSEQWGAVCADMKTLLTAIQAGTPERAGIPLSDWDGDSGKTPEFTAERISFNGVGEDGCESFVITRTGAEWSFCKTQQRPYDVAVTAALCYFATVAQSHDVSSDGRARDFQAGLDAARDALPNYTNTLDIAKGVKPPAG